MVESLRSDPRPKSFGEIAEETPRGGIERHGQARYSQTRMMVRDECASVLAN